MIQKVINWLVNYWTTDKSLSTLLVFLILVTFVLFPFSSFQSFWFRFFMNTILSLILISGVFSVSKTPSIRTPAIIMAILIFIIKWLTLIGVNRLIIQLDLILSIFYLVVIALVVLRKIFNPGPVNFYRIQGAVAVYLIMAIIWTNAYMLVFTFIPDAFHFPMLPNTANDYASAWSNLHYFSFSCLTTMGFGDILATNIMSRSLVIMEGVSGQIYLTVMIARLVSMELLGGSSKII